jgi:hypothetical protein
MNKDLKPCPLKNCPLCGGLASQYDWGADQVVCCDDCEIAVKEPTMDEAVNLWNTRPPSPALKVAREALEKCKSECSCGAIGCVGHDDTCPVHLKQDALALLAKEGV